MRIHSGNGPHEEMDRRAIACFDQALDDAGLDDDDRCRRVLHDYFAWATTTTMAAHPVSADDVPSRPPHPSTVLGRLAGRVGRGGSPVHGLSAITLGGARGLAIAAAWLMQG